MTNPCTQNFIDSMVNRRYSLVHKTPPPRIDSLALSPYSPNIINPTTKKPYTQFDLNMRRKAEILKYSSNRQSTQTNNFTKKQQWAQIATGNYQKFSPTLYTPITNTATGATSYTLVCDVSGVRTPSYACDVPGPLIYLYDDPNVLLYMYQTNQDAYAIIPNSIPNPFQIQDLGISITPLLTGLNYFKPTNFSSVIVTQGIVNPLTRFTITIPIGIRFIGTVAEFQNNVSYSFVSPTNVALNIYYGESNQPNSNIPYNSATNPNSSYQLNGIFVSGQSSGTIAFNVVDTNQSFIFDTYIGSVQFANIPSLSTQPLTTYFFACSIVNLSNNVILTTSGALPTDTISYQLMINPPDPSKYAYFKQNTAIISAPIASYYPMTILPLNL